MSAFLNSGCPTDHFSSEYKVRFRPEAASAVICQATFAPGVQIQTNRGDKDNNAIGPFPEDAENVGIYRVVALSIGQFFLKFTITMVVPPPGGRAHSAARAWADSSGVWSIEE